MMKRFNLLYLSLFLVLLFMVPNIFAQKAEQKAVHSISLSPKFVQIKDAFNYGLNFNGLNLEVGYLLEKKSESHLFTYSANLAFGANYNNGIGLFWQFKPVDIFYGFDISNKKDNIIFIGPYFQTFYNWQLYPELQSGQMFWLFSFKLEPLIQRNK